MFTPGHPEYIKSINDVRLALIDLQRMCEELDLPMSILRTEKALRELSAIETIIKDETHHIRRHINDHTIPRLVNSLINDIQDETSMRIYLHLPESSKDLFTSLHPFGDHVYFAFPDAAVDIEEAAKCLALKRNTASVFHLMNAVDFGIRNLILTFNGGTEFLEKNTRMVWSEYVGRIRKEAHKPNDAIAPRWVGRQSRLEQVAQSLNHLADVHRNPTMHARKAYTDDHARDVFDATRGAMRRLAEDLHADDA